ncbi:hypothetical protein PHLGIDRAFT_16082 [Phlebiopsis gigantea 11061_1 CR5-6]|uniref:Uncharacterized protein n=1 Tax=Phlebiopsis gigantea (strain 11061_1 CR5-6) TaxID=745531 RepID=A0A0C3S4R2_PHLG1|nr:hypothetical protein PHLGIDRAFT_16082 [Phlebiopsis gigantea 11061_1 CR5-6]
MAKSPAPSNLASADSPMKAFLLFILCMVMHAVLVGLHLALVILRYKKHGDEFRITNQRVNDVAEVLFYYVTLAPNAIIKVYLVPLLFVVQKLALKRDLNQKQSLTAMHDKSAAWLSLGVTGATMWKYRSLFHIGQPDKEIWRRDIKAFGGVVCILLYLGGNSTNVARVTSLLASIGQDSNQLQEAFPIVDIIPLSTSDGDLATTGLDYNLIYDIPHFFTDSVVHVNGTAFEVNCGKIPGLTQAGKLNTTSGTFPIHVHDELQDIQISPTSRTLNIRSAQWLDTSLSHAPPPVIFVASTFRLVDDANFTIDALVSLDPAVSPETCFVPSDCLSSVQVVGCSISTKPFSDIQVSTNTYPFHIDETNATIDEAKWTNWSLPIVPTDPILTLASKASIGSFPGFSPTSRSVQSFGFQGTNITKTYTLTMLEDNLMEALQYYKADFAETTLGAIQAVLGDTIATVFWRAAERIVDSEALPEDNAELQFNSSIGISKWTPWFGLGISLVMLVIAAIVTRQPIPRRNATLAHVDGLGVLELTWLLGKNMDKTGKGSEGPTHDAPSRQEIARWLAHNVDDPTLENLRNKGKEIETEFHD